MVLLLSWNVAGLSTTVARIHETYDKDTSSSCSAFEYYLQRHEADIICLQEHKIPYSQLSNRSEPRQCATLKGYESFWSKTTKTGMNGVVTYVRKGMTVSANAATILGDETLDDQGRCVMTDHGDFAVFNVYVPCNGGHALREKMRFLYALRRAMKACNKPVVLAGDYNISHTAKDKYWRDRVMVIEDILASDPGDNIAWKQQVCKAWPQIEAALTTAEAVEVQTTNPTTGQKFQKYRLQVTLMGEDKNKRKVYLGKHEPKPEYATWQYNMEECRYECPLTGDDDKLSCRANTISVATLTELMLKIGGVVWDEAMQRTISNSIPGVCQLNPPRQWMNALIQEDEMVDVFRQYYPTAEGRFTCWNQNTNRRYANEGARIDYILLSKELVKAQQGTTETLRSSGTYDPLSEQAALCAATENGLYQPVSFQGGGIVSVSREVLDRQFGGGAHTGMVYTPPSFSDHIGISAIINIDGNDQKEPLILQNDKETKRTQPHKAQQSISSFFTAGGKRSTTTNTTLSKKKQKKPLKPKTNSILHHFGVKK